MNVFDQIAESYPKRTLSDDESRALTFAAHDGDEAAAMQLLSNYLPMLKRLIGNEITTGISSSVTTDDLRSAAIEGFLDALYGFDAAADKTISHRVRLRVEDRLKTERIASAISVPSRTYRRCMAALEDCGGSTARAIASAALYGVSPETMAAVFDARPQYDERLEEHEATTRRQIQAEDLDDSNRALAALDPQSRLVIETLYGFGREPLSTREASAVLGIPRTSLQRIASTALLRMRAALGAQ